MRSCAEITGFDCFVSAEHSIGYLRFEQNFNDVRGKRDFLRVFWILSTGYEGWLELASARHSMGPSRLSSALLDLKVQSAATTVMLNELVEESQSVNISPLDVTLESTAVDENVRALSLSENSSTTSESIDEKKRRYKSVSVFGAFVSPKLRAAQVSFETGGIMAGRKVEVLEGEIGQLKTDFVEKILDFQNQFASIHEKMDGRFAAMEDMMKKMLEDKQNPVASVSKETTCDHGKGRKSEPI
ncbi:hypothetical protein M5K25_016345 [Dendrobium thyrsiflorum]|uniref:Vacuolar ATPase assembly protein VMA22 n=1 Tax=Dendrobium thyrsiflorum TaxID=117978 RepID=A0ABD0UJZ6_DENTH